MNCLNLTKLLLGVRFILISSSVIAQERTVSGKVTDPDGKPIQGVTVKVKNTTTATTTNANGEFTIKAPSAESMISFSHVSFVFFERAAGTDDNIEIRMAAAEKSMDEVVVVGYGSQKKTHLTGSVGIVDIKAIQDLPVGSLSEALKGQVVGVGVAGGYSRPGEPATITIRNPIYFVKRWWFKRTFICH